MSPAHGSVQSIDRVLDIIEALSTAPQGMSLSDLAAMTDLHVSTAHRLVTALVDRGYAKKDTGRGKYRLTLRLFEIGSSASRVLGLLSASKQFLDELADFSQEAVHLVERDSDEVVYLYKSEPAQQLVRMSSCVGCRNPMYCTGVGKSILAFLPEAEAARIWDQSDIQAFTCHTITDWPAMQQEMARIRASGYAMDNEEHEHGVRCVAAPIWNWEDEPVGAISISAPVSRMDETTIQRMVPRLLSATQEISSLLGHVSTAQGPVR